MQAPRPLGRLATATFLLLVLATLAGCTDEAPPPEDDPTEPLAAPREPYRGTATFGWRLRVAEGPMDFSLNTQDPGPFNVAHNATDLEMDVQWSCAQGDCGLDLRLLGPGDDRGGATTYATHSGGSPATFSVPAPPEGTWRLVIESTATSAEMEGFVTFHYDADASTTEPPSRPSD